MWTLRFDPYRPFDLEQSLRLYLEDELLDLLTYQQKLKAQRNDGWRMPLKLWRKSFVKQKWRKSSNLQIWSFFSQMPINSYLHPFAGVWLMKIKDSLWSVLLPHAPNKDYLPTLFDGKKFQTKLLFRGSKDGFSSEQFHNLCDNKGPTLVLVKSRLGFYFGGFNRSVFTDSGLFPFLFKS